jgi:CRISPR-associated protein Csx10
MRWRVLMQAKTPLSFRSGRTQQSSATLPYVPGTSVLGALAQAHQTLGRPPEEFSTFFLDDAVRLSNLYPACFANEDVGADDEAPILPLPLTARSCKRFPGFRQDAHDPRDAPHGVTDGLIPLALFALGDQQKIPIERRLAIMEPLRLCPQCQEPLDRIVGFFRSTADEQFGKASEKDEIRTRSAISYQTGAVKSELLYSRATIAAGTSFWGEWDITDTIAPAFTTFVESASDGRWLRIGNNRTRGFGLVTMGYVPRESEDSVTTLHERIGTFTAHLQARGASGVALDAPAYAPLTLASDMILYDRLLRPRLEITGDDLAAFPGLSGARVVHTVAAARRIEGWNDLWGLPRGDEWAIGMGSVALIALPDLTDTVCQGLLQLQETGLGRRRSEGYGRVVVAHHFHTTLVGVYQ